MLSGMWRRIKRQQITIGHSEQLNLQQFNSLNNSSGIINSIKTRLFCQSFMFTCMTHLQLSTGEIVRYAVSDITNTKVNGAISALVHGSSTHWVEFPVSHFNTHSMEQFKAYRLECEPLVYGEKEYGEKEQWYVLSTLITGV